MKTDGNIRSPTIRPWPLIAIALVFLIAACAGNPPTRGEYEQSIHATARVVAIDREARRVTLRIGLRHRHLRYAPGVTGFDRRKVGDKIDVEYKEAVLLAVARDHGETPPVLQKYKLSGETDGHPAVVFVRARRFTAEFLGIDQRSKIMTLRGPNGTYHSLLTPLQLRNFVATLRPGDVVSVSIEEAMTVSLRSPGPG